MNKYKAVSDQAAIDPPFQGWQSTGQVIGGETSGDAR